MNMDVRKQPSSKGHFKGLAATHIGAVGICANKFFNIKHALEFVDHTLKPDAVLKAPAPGVPRQRTGQFFCFHINIHGGMVSCGHLAGAAVIDPA